MNIFNDFPDFIVREDVPLVPIDANGHVHTPYSFSSFDDIQQIFIMAKQEGVSIVGINDFFVADGYNDFMRSAMNSTIFPLFNIEFIGLITDFQKKGIRINDPNNPGRIYFSGKGLDIQMKLSATNDSIMKETIQASQDQVYRMIEKVDSILKEFSSLGLTIDYVKKFSKELVRERHIAKAIRTLMVENFKTEETQKSFLESLYGGKPTEVNVRHDAELENELRNNLLKKGGRAFVEEDEKAFLPLDALKSIIIDAGGIPCYPVLLDDKKGVFTEYEADMEELYFDLTTREIWCLELISTRNDPKILENFVSWFHDRGFVVTLGTEHNAPGITPLKLYSRGGAPLSDHLRMINYKGCCVVAAHQYLRAKGREGYLDKFGIPKVKDRNDFINIGNQVIRYFLKY